MAGTTLSSRFKELLKKYGKVALGVHFSVSAISITSLYVAIKNNVDVDSLFSRLHLPSPAPSDSDSNNSSVFPDEFKDDAEAGSSGGSDVVGGVKSRSRTAEIAASAGGALGLAILCNKALFPVRVPITLALTPPIARFLARRKIIKDGGIVR
ncbi:hypothetical protein MLD38_013504 [Melastoma candidum]|uniref:Uncharacterized protein n=1 Tax=Melastoma candidum TaxID=119954 RepID=A0ACB9R9E6_9MYRT|nr:hypothetical protein MLD38_013504 [Melastoma candidum]